VRCPRCGNENSGGNRFCGMCGASLIAGPQPAAAAPSGSRGEKKEGPAGERFSDEPRLPARPAPAAAPEPSVAGPSFLGLNKPGDGQRGRDLHGRSSRSVDYLLEDEDNEPNGGRGKIALVLIALILAGVFGYLYWRQGGFDWVLKGNKPAAAAQSSPAEPVSGAAPTPAPSDSTGNVPAGSSSAASGNPANQPAANEPSGTPAQQNPNAATSTPPTPPENSPASTASQSPASDNAAATAAEKPSSENLSSDKPSTEKSSDADDDSNSEPAETAKPSPAPRRIRKPTPATPLDISAEADRYIYGRGVTQDCDRGLKLLKAAAQYDPKAMIKMGVLYSSGTCAPRDLPTAYRWFAMALHKDPNNQAVQDDLQQLWGQMTQPERQLAIKLSQ
jgi:hypothetical protein